MFNFFVYLHAASAELWCHRFIYRQLQCVHSL